jgi:hypothetical protein
VFRVTTGSGTLLSLLQLMIPFRLVNLLNDSLWNAPLA